MTIIRLTWADNNSGTAQEGGFRVYRSSNEIDIAALPLPLAELSADTVTYDDTAALTGDSYYVVSAFSAGIELLGVVKMITVGGGVVPVDMSVSELVATIMIGPAPGVIVATELSAAIKEA